jgi:hypothetical protein
VRRLRTPGARRRQRCQEHRGGRAGRCCAGRPGVARAGEPRTTHAWGRRLARGSPCPSRQGGCQLPRLAPPAGAAEVVGAGRLTRRRRLTRATAAGSPRTCTADPLAGRVAAELLAAAPDGGHRGLRLSCRCGRRPERSEGSPDAAASVAGQHGECDGEPKQADEPMGQHLLGRRARVQDAGELQDDRWEAPYAGQKATKISQKIQRQWRTPPAREGR